MYLFFHIMNATLVTGFEGTRIHVKAVPVISPLFSNCPFFTFLITNMFSTFLVVKQTPDTISLISPTVLPWSLFFFHVVRSSAFSTSAHRRLPLCTIVCRVDTCAVDVSGRWCFSSGCSFLCFVTHYVLWNVIRVSLGSCEWWTINFERSVCEFSALFCFERECWVGAVFLPG